MAERRDREVFVRYALPVLGISIGVALAVGGFTRACDRATTAALSEEARVAMEVGCRGREGHAERKCRDMLKRLYLGGSLDPDKTLRAYCEEMKNARWGGGHPPPPEVCVRRYGGWREG
jgi:hypothetical protein